MQYQCTWLASWWPFHTRVHDNSVKSFLYSAKCFFPLFYDCAVAHRMSSSSSCLLVPPKPSSFSFFPTKQGLYSPRCIHTMGVALFEFIKSNYLANRAESYSTRCLCDKPSKVYCCYLATCSFGLLVWTVAFSYW